jgi:hypothetical protein
MKLIFRGVSVLALAAFPVRAQRLPPQATTTAVLTSVVSFGMAGIASGETARVNTLNLAAGGPLIAGGSCQVTVTFLDEGGKTLATAMSAVGQGQSAHFDLPRTTAEPGADPVEIRATVSAAFSVSATASTASASSCAIVPTMEIFDQATGRTAVHLETTHALAAVVPLAATPE